MPKPEPRKIRGAIIGLLALAALSAGPAPGPAGPGPAPRLAIRAEAAATVNRDPAGRALSVVVRVYQLKEPTGFTRLTFDAAAGGRPEPELLGSSFLAATDLTLAPGTTRQALVDLCPETRFLGIAGFFRQPDPHHWRCLARLDLPAPPAEAEAARRPSWLKRAFTKKPPPQPPPGPLELAFTVQDCYLRLHRPQAEPIPGQPETFRPECAPAASGPGLVP